MHEGLVKVDMNLLLLLSIGAVSAVDVELAHTAVIGALETTTVVGTPSVPSVFAANPSACSSPVNLPAQISSPFGPRWKSSTSAYDMHRGIDYFDETGVPIYAAAAGTVFKVYTEAGGGMSGGGNVVVLEHAVSGHDWAFHDRTISKYYSYYLHMDTIDASVVVDASVANGAVIGTMGQSGDTQFTHLHFEIRLEGYCSVQYQIERTDRETSPTSSCYTGFDPHVHPFLFIGTVNPPPGAASGTKTLQEIVPLDGYVFAVRYNTTRRGHLDFDALETDVASFVINTRENIQTATLELMDDLPRITPNVALLPGRFTSTSEEVFYDFQFQVQPAYVEVRDIYGRGLRWTSDPHRPRVVRGNARRLGASFCVTIGWMLCLVWAMEHNF